MGTIQNRIAVVFMPVLVAAVVAAGLHGNAVATPRSAELGAATPEAVVERIRQAAEQRDMFELAASIEPAGLQEMAEGLALITALTVAFSAMADGEDVAARRTSEMGAILARYDLPGLVEDGAVERGSMLDAIGGMDHLPLINLVTDLAAFMESMAEEEEGINSEFLPPFEGELINLVIDGDEASAQIGDEEIAFVRLDGRWFARLPEPSQSADDSAFGASWGDASDSAQAGVEEARGLMMPTAGEDALDENGRRWYVYRAPDSGAFSLSTRRSGESSGDLVLEAYLDEDFSHSVARSDSDHGGDRANESIAIGMQAGQTVHVRVSQWGFDRNPLSFHVEADFAPGEVVAMPTTDWGHASSDSSAEASDASQGQAIAIGETRETWLAGEETVWFIISAPAAGIVSVTTRGTGEDDGDLKLEAFLDEPGFHSVDYSDTDLLGEYSHEIVRADVDAGQQVYVRVSQWGSDDISYRLAVQFTER